MSFIAWGAHSTVFHRLWAVTQGKDVRDEDDDDDDVKLWSYGFKADEGNLVLYIMLFVRV